MTQTAVPPPCASCAALRVRLAQQEDYYAAVVDRIERALIRAEAGERQQRHRAELVEAANRGLVSNWKWREADRNE